MQARWSLIVMMKLSWSMLDECQKSKQKQKISVLLVADLPTRLGDYGLESVNGMTWLVRATSFEEIVVKKQRSLIEPTIELQYATTDTHRCVADSWSAQYVECACCIVFSLKSVGCSISTSFIWFARIQR